jgi:hypothetical protein
LKCLLLRGLALLAVAIGMPSHLAQAGIWRFGVADAVLSNLAIPLHVDPPLSVTKIEVLGQPCSPSAVRHLLFGFDQHVASVAIVLVSGGVTQLQLALDQWDSRRPSDFPDSACR